MAQLDLWYRTAVCVGKHKKICWITQLDLTGGHNWICGMAQLDLQEGTAGCVGKDSWICWAAQLDLQDAQLAEWGSTIGSAVWLPLALGTPAGPFTA